MILENKMASLLYYFKLCASFQIHRWIQTGVTVRKRSIRVKIGDFLSCVALKFDGWLWKTIGHLFYATSSFVHHFIAITEFKLELQPGNLWMTVKNNRAPLRYNVKICASFQSHRWIETGVTVWKSPILVKIGDFLSRYLEISWMTLKYNRAPLLCCFKLCASFHNHHWIQTGISPETPNLGQNRRFF